MKRICLLLLLAACCTPMWAQRGDGQKNKQTVDISGAVEDAFTRVGLRAFVTLMREDSTVIDTMRVWAWEDNAGYFFNVPREQRRYLVKAECDGYETAFCEYLLKPYRRKQDYEIPAILMKKKADDDIYKNVGLDGIVVKGTQVKFTYRGDTLVYNASAFKLPEGSMLDALIRQLPGAELKDNGDIYVNGRKVDYLMLNGDDFFRGRNKVMLENLPYYTVKDLKVYNRQTDRDRALGKETEKREYVMDVSLKREYSVGWLGNAEVGAGTRERWMSRLFAARFTEHSRLSAYGNANNVNETRTPDYNGEWEPTDMPQGVTTTQQAGLTYKFGDKEKRWSNRLEAQVEWQKANNETLSKSTRFSTDGDIISTSQSSNVQRNFNGQLEYNFQLQKPFYLESRSSLYFSNIRDESGSFAQSDANTTETGTRSEYKSIDFRQSFMLFKTLPSGDIAGFTASAGVKKDKPIDSYTDRRILYPALDSTYLQKQWNDRHGSGYNWSVSPIYRIDLNDTWHLQSTIAYSQDYSSEHGDYYDFDSTAYIMDYANSSRHQQLTRTVMFEPNIIRQEYQRGGDYKMMRIAPRLTYINERLHYEKERLDTTARRGYLKAEMFFNLSNYINKETHTIYYDVDANLRTTMPRFTSLMPVAFDSNPLAVVVNNPDLERSYSQDFNIHRSITRKRLSRTFSWKIEGTFREHKQGNRTTYNSQTGAYTTTPDNVGKLDWSAGGTTRFSQDLDSARHFHIGVQLKADFAHNVDFDIAYDDLTSDLSQVNTLTLEPKLWGEISYGDLKLKPTAKLKWRRSTSDRTSFTRISAIDYDYGLALQYKIPWASIDLATSFQIYSRRGYDYDAMNTDDLIWNASLSRELLKNKLSLKLTAFDLLHQLSSRQLSVNAQGRYETQYNCIPSYAMLSLTYKFNKNPKK